MRLEKVNDKQVRCVMNSQDLAAHQITVKELQYGNQKATALFKEVVGKAIEEYHFNEEGLPIMIEAVPMRMNELLLIITAIEDAEELDPHFATFTETPATEGGNRNTNHFQEISEDSKGPKGCVFRFHEMEEVIAFVKRIPLDFSSTLYRKQEGIFLTIDRPDNVPPKVFSILLNSLMEFGEYVPANYLVYGGLKEHETPVLLEPIQKLRNADI